MKRFHRVMSITLLVLASVILVVELFRAGSLYPRLILIATLVLFCSIVQHLYKGISQWIPEKPRYQRSDDSLNFTGR